jgi:hypothetical protein
MDCLYNNLLSPELYSDKKVALFIETLHEEEIELASDVEAENVTSRLLSPDDIAGYMHQIEIETENALKSFGSVSPAFFAFFSNRKPPIRLLSDNPSTQDQVNNLLSAGKCLAFVSGADAIFFRSMVYHEGVEVLVDKKQSVSPQTGIHIVGSSVRGNAFIFLSHIDLGTESVSFSPVYQKIMREGLYEYPFSNFYSIKDPVEMQNILEQLPKIMSKLNSNQRCCLINFLTTLKVLHECGHEAE